MNVFHSMRRALGLSRTGIPLTVITFLVLAASPVRAQYNDGLPPSPAFGVGQRIYHESQNALAYAARLDASGNPVEAAAERRIGMLRANQAVKILATVNQSQTYGKSAVAAEALLAQARIQRDILKSQTQALQSFQTLHANYASINYPDKAVAEKERLAYALAVDNMNRTTFPTSLEYAIMNFLVGLTGRTSQSYWIAIVLISVIVKGLLWPLSNKQYKSIKETQKLQPLVKELQGKYKNDKELQGKKMMELYKEHGINPLAGCLPMVVQMPIWFALVSMIRAYTYQFQHGSFLWIGSPLSKMYPTIFAPDLSQFDIPLLVIYVLSMYVQQKMTTIVTVDPQQAEQQKMMAVWMPFMSAYFFYLYHWPSAFLLYYLIFNILSMVQQQMYMKSGNGGALVTAKPQGLLGLDKLSDKATAPNGIGTDAGIDKSNSNGVRPAAKGVIAPKVHPKKRRR